MDMENVTKGLYQHCEGSMFDRCGECPYYDVQNEPFICRDMLLNDLNAMLKEQEAKWVEDKQGDVCRLIKCSNCGLTFIVGNNIPYDEWIVDKNYCRRCGARMVKRNDK